MPLAGPAPARRRLLSSEQAIVNAAAHAHGISPATLWGVFGTESSFGTNEGPSSAGAEGPFQFLPSTASHYGFNPATAPFSVQANAAAKYLHDLGANSDPSSQSTQAALNSYSGGGGQTYINSVLHFGSAGAAENTYNSSQGLTTTSLAGPFSSIGDALKAIAGFFAMVSSKAYWLRMGEILIGVVLVYMGLHALTGQGPSAETLAKGAATAIVK